MNFLEFITEATKSASQQNKPKKPTTSQKGQKTSGNLEDKHVAITFGRFNPPHAGHGKLLDAVKAHGGDSETIESTHPVVRITKESVIRTTKSRPHEEVISLTQGQDSKQRST